MSITVIAYVVIFTILGSIFSLIGGILLLSRQKLAHRLTHLLAAFAAGVLLGSAFLDLLPEALHEAEELQSKIGYTQNFIFLSSLLGITLFFLLERFIHWFHHHQRPHKEVAKPTVALVVLGDSVHNLIDGMVIAATFIASIPLGIVTTIAVAAHEIPQEIGDFAILLHEGVNRKKVLMLNFISALAALLGAFLVLLIGEFVKNLIPFALSLTAGFFIYIAAADIIPDIHQENRKGFALLETFLLLLGIGVVGLSISFLNH